MVRISDNIVAIPSGRTDLIPDDYTIIDKREYIDCTIPEPTFTLRPKQQEAVDMAETSCMINAKVGWGKSIAALGIAHNLQLKTLIVCTNVNIRQMWEEEVEKWFGFKPGVIGGGKFELHTPIVIGNIQTVNKRGTELASEFGLVVVDEAHHCTASTFTSFLQVSRAAVKIGLSGTLKRKDGMHVAFPDFFSHKIFVPPVENTIVPKVHCYDSGVELQANEMIPWAIKVNNLLANDTYRSFILTLAQGYHKLGHQVLVVADRVEFLEFINDNLESSVAITGAIDMDDRPALLQSVKRGEKDNICATMSIFSEGVSCNPLGVVILATPTNNDSLLEQLAGRVMRQSLGKSEAIVVDVAVRGNTGYNQATSRRLYYAHSELNPDGGGLEVYEYTINRLVTEILQHRKTKSTIDQP